MDTATTVPTIFLYKTELRIYYRNEKGDAERCDETDDYHMSEEEAQKFALTLSKPWRDNPYRYLVTTEHNNIRIYDKDEDEVRAVIFVSKHQFVEVG